MLLSAGQGDRERKPARATVELVCWMSTDYVLLLTKDRAWKLSSQTK